MNQSVSTHSPADRKPSGWRRAILVVCILTLAISGIVWWRSQPAASDFAREARRSLRMSRFDEALDAAEEAIRLGEDTTATQLLAGEAAMRLNRYSVALEHFDLVDDSVANDALAARISSASILLNRHEVGSAEEQLRRALQLAPQNDNGHALLSDCLGLQGRRWESVPYLLHRIRGGDINLQTLCYLADTERTVDLSEEQLASAG